jgi:mannosyltransferase
MPGIISQRLGGVSEIGKPKEPPQLCSSWQLLREQTAILIIYFILAFYRIGHQSLWVDEIRSLDSAGPGGSLFTSDILFRGQGPLYFGMLHFWAQLGANEAFVRSLSALLGGVAVFLMYTISLRLLNRRLARIATIIFATSPFLIWYSQEARYVILMMTTALLAMWTFVRFLSTERLGWFPCSCSLILAVAASPMNIVLPIAQGLYLACCPARRGILQKWMICQFLVFTFFFWWANEGYLSRLGGFWQSLSAIVTTAGGELMSSDGIEPLSTGGVRKFTTMALPYTFFTFSTGFSLGPSVRELQMSRDVTTLLPHALTLLISGILFGGLFLLGLVTLSRQSELWKFLTAWLVIPILVTLGVAALVPTMAYNVRYVAMSLPAYCLILALGIADLKPFLMRITLLAALLLFNGLSLANYYFNPQYSREDARSAAEFLQGTAHLQDIILVIGSTTALKYYYKESVPMISWNQQIINDHSALANRLHELSQYHDRLWLIEIRPWEKDRKATLKSALDARYDLIDHRAFPGANIYLYRVN